MSIVRLMNRIPGWYFYSINDLQQNYFYHHNCELNEWARLAIEFHYNARWQTNYFQVDRWRQIGCPVCLCGLLRWADTKYEKESYECSSLQVRTYVYVRWASLIMHGIQLSALIVPRRLFVLVVPRPSVWLAGWKTWEDGLARCPHRHQTGREGAWRVGCCSLFFDSTWAVFTPSFKNLLIVSSFVTLDLAVTPGARPKFILDAKLRMP